MEHQAETIFTEFIRYNNWANNQVIVACLKLSTEQLRATVPGTYGPIHETLGHIIHAEADYVERLTGECPEPGFSWEEGPSVAKLAAYAVQVADALIDAAVRVSPTQIVHEEEGGKFIDYEARVLFIQIINHGIEHRTNITTILSSLGYTPLEVDGWGYLWAHQDKFKMREGDL